MAREKPWWKQTPNPPPAPVEASPAPEAPSLEAPPPEAAASPEAAVPQDPGPPALAELADGESTTMMGSGREPYVLKNVAGVYSCSCPAWRNAGGAINLRSCKHLRKLRGDAAETHRIGAGAARGASAARVASSSGASSGTTASGTAPPVLLAHAWDNVTDVTRWWMSEKLDGVRAYWDGERFLSRLGNEFFAPAWFTERLPKTPLDGELWGGRKQFQRTVSTVRRQDRSEAWREIRYLVFDVPSMRAPFEERYAELARLVAELGAPHVEAHVHAECESLEALRAELARVESLGGEGLMMRRPGSLYEVGRSHTLLKVKSFHDAEARVVGHLPGAGKHKGRLGALECAMPNGTRFSVGTGLSDDERRSPPPIGSVVTYRYQELSNDGVPRFPSYVGIRDDVAFPEEPAASAAPAPRPPARSVQSAAIAAPAELPTHRFRRFVRDGVSWEIALDGASHRVRRLLPNGALEVVATTFPHSAAAWRDAEARLRERVADGYEEAPDD
jgi:DNA ligase 1